MAENQGDRLQKARIKAGFKTAADAARAFGWPAITYRAQLTLVKDYMGQK